MRTDFDSLKGPGGLYRIVEGGIPKKKACWNVATL